MCESLTNENNSGQVSQMAAQGSGHTDSCDCVMLRFVASLYEHDLSYGFHQSNTLLICVFSVKH